MKKIRLFIGIILLLIEFSVAAPGTLRTTHFKIECKRSDDCPPKPPGVAKIVPIGVTDILPAEHDLIFIRLDGFSVKSISSLDSGFKLNITDKPEIIQIKVKLDISESVEYIQKLNIKSALKCNPTNLVARDENYNTQATFACRR